MAKKKSFNSIIAGIIPGILLPAISIYLFYVFQDAFSGKFDQYIKRIFEYRVFSKVLSVCLIANLAIFFIFIKTNRYKSARGVIVATFLYAAFILVYMFLL